MDSKLGLLDFNKHNIDLLWCEFEEDMIIMLLNMKIIIGVEIELIERLIVR